MLCISEDTSGAVATRGRWVGCVKKSGRGEFGAWSGLVNDLRPEVETPTT